MATPLPLFPTLAAPATGRRVDVLILAGEHSGDQHGALLAGNLLTLRPEWRIAAIGGPALAQSGAEFLFDLAEHSVVGLVEVLRHFTFFQNFFKAVTQWIVEHRPRAICLIDYPGFNLRLASRLREMGWSRQGGGEGLIYYYISPQIWAWKGHRRHALARTVDAMAVIFPFETDCYRDTPLPVRFVGHPMARAGTRLPVAFDPNGPVLLLPGSRIQPVNRIFPLLREGWARYRERHGAAPACVIYPSPAIREALDKLLPGGPDAWGISLHPASQTLGGRAVLTSSGTMSLACALAGLPGAIVYRAHPVTYWLGKRFVTVPHLGIANLLLPERPIYPEYLQSAATPDALAEEIESAAHLPQRATSAAEAARELHRILTSPADGAAAEWLVELVENTPSKRPVEVSTGNH